MKVVLSFFAVIVLGAVFGQNTVQWTNLKNVTLNTNVLTKGTGLKGQATSTNMLYGAFSGDFNNGSLSFSTGSISNENKVIGYTVVESAELAFENIEYGFSFQTNKVKAYGKEGFIEQIYSGSKDYKLERMNDVMNYYIDNQIVYTERVDVGEFLAVRAILKNNAASVSGLTLSFASTRPELNPNIDYITKTISTLSSGQNFTVLWDDGEKGVVSKKFVTADYAYQVQNAENDYVQRAIAIGENVSWQNLSGLSLNNNVLEKTSGNNWGTANSTQTFSASSSFWMQNILQSQSESKAFGLVLSTTNLQYTNQMLAGFMISKDNQVQIIHEGAVIRTIEANANDVLQLFYENGIVSWKLNGTTLEQKISSNTAAMRIGTLLKNGTSLSKFTYAMKTTNINKTWDNGTEKGSISFDISTITGIQGPYHYKLNDSYIPPFREIYEYVRDSLSGGTLDSATFYLGNNSASTFSVNQLETGTYYYAVFNSLGQRIIGGQLLLGPELTLSNLQGMEILADGSYRSTSTNASLQYEVYFDENTSNGRIEFPIQETVKKHRFGLVDAANPGTIRLGFEVENRRIRTIQDGVVSSVQGDVISGKVIASIVKIENDFQLIVRNRIIFQANIGGGYTLKGGAATEILGVGVKPGGGTLGKAKKVTVTYTATHADCSADANELKILVKSASDVSYSYTLLDLSTMDGVSGNGVTEVELVLQNIPPGIYKFSGTLATTPPTNFEQMMYLGVKAQFSALINYDLTPNTYSISKNTLSTTALAKAISANTLKADEPTGWFSFIPYQQKKGSPSGPVDFDLLFKNHYVSFVDGFDMAVPTGTYIDIAANAFSNQTTIYKFFQNGVLVQNTIIASGTRISGIFYDDAGTPRIKFLSEGDLIAGAILNRPAGKISLKFITTKKLSGFRDILFSFTCFKPGINDVSYRKVERQLTADFSYALEGKVKFVLDEEYEMSANKSIPIRLYTDKNELLAQVSLDGTISNNLTALAYNFEDNRYILNISAVPNIAIGKYYYLEFTNSKNDKRYFKFYYKN